MQTHFIKIQQMSDIKPQ